MSERLATSTQETWWGWIAGHFRGNNVRSSRLVIIFISAVLLAINLFLHVMSHFDIVPKFISAGSGGLTRPLPLEKSGQIYLNIGILLFLIVAMVSSLSRERQSVFWLATIRTRVGTATSQGAGILTVIFFTWGVFISYPPAISSINFRYLWVDWLGNDDKFRYVGQIIRSIFYDYPHLLQGAAFSTLFYTLYRIGRGMGLGTGLLVLPTSLLLSGTVLMYSSLAEDWLVAAGANMVIYWAYMSRCWPAVLLVFLTSAGIRLPESAITFFSIMLVEALRPARVILLRRPQAFVFFTANSLRVLVLAFAAIGACYLGFLFFHGFGEGDFGYIYNLEPRVIDGFLLHRLSGVYFAHFLWSVPMVAVASLFAVIWIAPRTIASLPARVALASALSVGLVIFFYEFYVERQLYYNYKYIASTLIYGAPALLYIARKARFGLIFVTVIAIGLLAGTAHTNIVSSLQQPLSARHLRDHQLYSCRNVLRPWLRTRMVYLNQAAAKGGGTYAVQYIAGEMIRSQYEGVKTLSDTKSVLNKNEAILTNDREEKQRFASDDRIVEVVSCRTWSLFIVNDLRP